MKAKTLAQTDVVGGEHQDSGRDAAARSFCVQFWLCKNIPWSGWAIVKPIYQGWLQALTKFS
jgi:hypothetical protein